MVICIVSGRTSGRGGRILGNIPEGAVKTVRRKGFSKIARMGWFGLSKGAKIWLVGIKAKGKAQHHRSLGAPKGDGACMREGS